MRWLDDMENIVRYTEVGRWRLQDSVGLQTLQSKATLRPLFILIDKGVAVNSKKCSVLPWKCKYVLPLHCCPGTKYFVLPLTITSINIRNVCVYSCLSFKSCKPNIFYGVMFLHMRPVWRYHIFPHFLINGRFPGKKFLYIKYMFDFLYKSCLKHFSF
jgi:hypothetical protein